MKMKIAIVSVVALSAVILAHLADRSYQRDKFAMLQNYGVVTPDDLELPYFEESNRDAHVRSFCVYSTSGSISLPPNASTSLNGIPTSGQIGIVRKFSGRSIVAKSLKSEAAWQHSDGSRIKAFILQCDDGEYLYLQAVK